LRCYISTNILSSPFKRLVLFYKRVRKVAERIKVNSNDQRMINNFFPEKAKTKTYFLMFFISVSINVIAQNQDRDMVKEHQIEEELRKTDATLVESFRSGTLAYDKADYQLADSLYSFVYQKAPTFDAAIRRLGGVKIYQRQMETGLSLCEKAVSIHRSYANLITLVNALGMSGGESTASIPRLNQAYELVTEARKMPDAIELECLVSLAQINLQLEATKAFITISKELVQKYPKEMVAHYYRAIGAAHEEEWKTAESEILLAKGLGLDETTVNNFLNSGIQKKARETNYGKILLWFFVFWLGGLVILYLLGLLLSNYTMRTVEQQLKNDSITSGSTLRSCYRFLINFAGFYYYISLPVILVLLVVLVGLLLYACSMLGFLPIKLMLILLVGAGVTIYGMIRSLLLKKEYADPGRELKQSEAPELFALTKEVAKTMGTREIDEIRITPETDLAVYEKGSWKEKRSDAGKRILILGIGVLKDFKQNDFRAVLAHEYGHFSHRDTAGGEIALRVRRDMGTYAHALYLAGQTVWWNMAFQFLRVYHFIFRRISNGATRLQEILADRVAAQTYGSLAFEGGLTHVIKRQIEFVKLAKIEIEDAKKIKRSFNNLYELTTASRADVETEMITILNRTTTLDDTHPSPVDRFRYIQDLGEGKKAASDLYVPDLFLNWPSITKEMTDLIEDSWKTQEQSEG
jgi:Zn-dependent protease with chaperone function